MNRWASLVLPLLAACGGDDASSPTDAGGTSACEEAFELARGSEAGHAEPLAGEADEARAGRLTEPMLPDDAKGLATWAPGDFVLANDRIGVLIEDVGESDIYDPWGGKIVGLSRVEGGRLVDPVDFEEVIVGLSRFTLETESVTVLADGAAGGPAVVRATGVLSPVPAIDELLATIIPGDYRDVPAALDYELAPGAEHFDVYLTVTWRRPAARVPIVLHAFIQANRMQTFAPEVGFDIGNEPVPFAAFVEEGRTGYAWRSADGPLEPLFADGGFAGFSAPAITLAGCTQNRIHLARVVVSGPGTDGLLSAVARVDGEAQRTVSGAVTTSDGGPAEGVRVHAVRAADGAYLTRATTDAAGAFVLHVPEDAGALRLTAFRRGDAVPPPVEVGVTETSADLVLPPAGRIHVLAHGPAGDPPLPARVQVIPLGELPSVPEAFGEEGPGSGRLHIVFPIDGDVTLPVPAGDHQVVVSHGFERELWTGTVTVAEGATAEVDAQLDPTVATPGVLCGDFHIHTHRSLDSGDEATLKVASAVADGVEILVRSDHEWVGDFQPVIEAMGLGAFAMGIGSDELSTNLYGHFGVFPLVADPTASNAGAIPWVYTKGPELFARVRARPEAPALIINHPRGGGLNGSKAYFDYVGYDPSTGTVDRPDYWDDSFTLVEVFNGSGFEQNRDASVRDWFSFLAMGRRVFAVGSSDSHRVTTNPVGYPRTCVDLGTDDPSAVSPEDVRDALLAGRATVSGGIFLDVRAPGDVGPGGDATGVGDRASLSVTVRAADWIDVDRLEIIVDGATAEILTLDETTQDPLDPRVRFSDVIEVPVASGALGSWVVLAATGDTPLDPVFPGRPPFAVSNPIFLAR